MVAFRARLIKFGTLPGMKPLNTACRLPGMNHAVYSVKRKQVPGESVSRNSYQMQGQAIKAIEMVKQKQNSEMKP